MTTLQEKIQRFYDASSGLWEQIWGEHMHHGYYGPDGSQVKERRQAQIDLIEELLLWGGVNSETLDQASSSQTSSSQTSSSQPGHILDVGCGIGGSALYLAEKFGSTVAGITLSPVQAQRASERAAAFGSADRAQFQVADALAMPFADQSFDLVWSMESGEHMPDKQQFLQECYRVLKPGGKFLMATWCHRPTPPALTPDEQEHLEKIYRVYCLPYVISLPDYAQIAQQAGFEAIRTEDWSAAVAPFWNRVIDSALTPSALIGLVQSGWTTIQAALSLGLMSRGYQRDLVKFGILVGTKPVS
jgi:tocopherol O-methyltransferase